MTFSWDHIQVVFADANAFTGIRQRHQHFASGLARVGMGVLYIEEPGNWLTVGRSPEKPATNWTAWKQEPREVEPNLWVWTPPPGMPIGYWSLWINARNHALYARRLTEVLGEPPPNRLALLACNPLAAAWLPHLEPARAVYDCCDEFEHFPLQSKRPEVTLALEQTLFSQCDFVVFSSATTMRHKIGPRVRPTRGGPRQRSPQGIPRRVAHLRNACDPKLFAIADPSQAPMPEDLALIAARGPIILYFGSLAHWLNDNLIGDLALARPDWQVVLIGPQMRAFRRLKGIPNCHLLGKKPHHILPHYAYHAQVAMLPHRLDRITSVADHVKVYEFLAAGLPIMATPMMEVRNFGDLIRIGATVGDWVTGIESLLKESIEAPERREQRLNFAASQTWESRVQGLRQVLGRPDKRQIDESRAAQWAEEERLLAQLRENARAELTQGLELGETSYSTDPPAS